MKDDGEILDEIEAFANDLNLAAKLFTPDDEGVWLEPFKRDVANLRVYYNQRTKLFTIIHLGR
jgi:hypothetical protein